MVLEDSFPQMHANVEKHWDVLFSLLCAAFILGKRISSEALKPLLNGVIWANWLCNTKIPQGR